MKTTINKSQLMQRAWEIYRRENNTPRFGWGANLKFEFRFALRMAWKEAKNAARRIERVPVQSTPITPSPAYMAGCAEYYATGSNGSRYFGD